MIPDASGRLAAAYGLIAILLLAAIVGAVLLARNSPRRRIQRGQARDAKYRQQRQQDRDAERATAATREVTEHQIAAGSEE